MKNVLYSLCVRILKALGYEVQITPIDDKEQARKLTSLRRRMWGVSFFLRFTKNNPKWLRQYYHEFICICGGYEKWKQVPPQIRSAWEASANSFDRMYGLIKAWGNSEGFFGNLKEKGTMNDEQMTINEVIVNAVKKTLEKEVAPKVENWIKNGFEGKFIAGDDLCEALAFKNRVEELMKKEGKA